MKRTALLLSTIGIAALLAGCENTEIEHTVNIVAGRYYTDGKVITEDGNTWSYSQDIISEMPSYDHEPVYALLDDMGTPRDIYDDEILGVVLDRETAICDQLEVVLSVE